MPYRCWGIKGAKTEYLGTLCLYGRGWIIRQHNEDHRAARGEGRELVNVRKVAVVGAEAFYQDRERFGNHPTKPWKCSFLLVMLWSGGDWEPWFPVTAVINSCGIPHQSVLEDNNSYLNFSGAPQYHKAESWASSRSEWQRSAALALSWIAIFHCYTQGKRCFPIHFAFPVLDCLEIHFRKVF